jgi:hypothetical protein
MGWLIRFVEGAARGVLRGLATLFGLVFGLFDLLFGFLTWPPKKLRIQIFILATEAGPVLTEADLTPAINFATKTFKDSFNVKLLPYGSRMVEIIKEPAPDSALNVGCGFSGLFEEYGQAGDFFAAHLAGWNALPVSGTFPVTVFIVSEVDGPELEGCSQGPLTDYVTVERAALLPSGGFMGLYNNPSGSVMAHEIGHACNLWHDPDQSHLMYKNAQNRGAGATWYQKNLLRSSRHVLYW